MLYLKGRHYWNERSDEGLLKAISYFEEAVKRDKAFALGYSGLADCYVVMGRNVWSLRAKLRERVRCRKGAGAGESWPRRSPRRPWGILHHADYNWRVAETEYKRAIELKPNYSTAHQWYAHLNWSFGGGCGSGD